LISLDHIENFELEILNPTHPQCPFTKVMLSFSLATFLFAVIKMVHNFVKIFISNLIIADRLPRTHGDLAIISL